jgi:hypothetical protein
MVKALSVVERLEKAVSDYLLWMISADYASGSIMRHERLLNHFQNFITNRSVSWEQVFTYDTLNGFEKHCNLYFAANVLRSFSRYLFKQKLIPGPIKKPLVRLPEIYEAYLHYYEKIRQIQRSSLVQTRNVLSALNDYLSKYEIDLAAVKIERIDNFLAEFNAHFMPATCRHNRSFLRGFFEIPVFSPQDSKKEFGPFDYRCPHVRASPATEVFTIR